MTDPADDRPEPDESHLRLLREAILHAARQNDHDPANPLRGYCAIVAQVVRGMFGGDLVTGKVSGEPHYWNRLPGGREVDLTSCQFGGDGYRPLVRGRKVRNPRPEGTLVDPMVLVFGGCVLKALGSGGRPEADYEDFWDEGSEDDD